jgi:chromosome partitioning protein
MNALTPPAARAKIIAFASPKGGVGKSTTCACLAASLVKRGYPVTILDLDQNRTLEEWARRFPAELRSMTIRGIGEGDLIDTIQQLYHTATGYILIDVAGAFHKTTIAAATLADLTITPARLSAPDVIEAVKLNREIRQLGAKIGKPITHRLLLNGVSPIWPTYQRAALIDVERSGIPRFETIIHERAPYGELFLTGQPPHFADRNREPIIKAVAQMDALTDEVLAALDVELEEKEAA